MRHHQAVIALSVISSLSAGIAASAKWQGARPVQEPASLPNAGVANPMASFARMVPGEWRRTAQTGTSMFSTWHWGPGKHSMRVTTDGFDAAGKPWHELQVVYWHPGRKQVCLLGISPFARGVTEGTIKFDGTTADALFDLYQTGGRRNLGLHWAFDGPDKYHETLLEATGAAGFKPIVEWDCVRSKTSAPGQPRSAHAAAKTSDRLQAFQPLLRHVWDAKGEWDAKNAFHIQSTFEWVPIADAIHARVLALSKDREPVHLLDAYVYYHTGAGALRCLALSSSGGVYQGDVTALDGGSLQIDLKGYEGDQTVFYVVRFDFAKDGTARHRVWSRSGTELALKLDTHHKSLELKKD